MDLNNINILFYTLFPNKENDFFTFILIGEYQNKRILIYCDTVTTKDRIDIEEGSCQGFNFNIYRFRECFIKNQIYTSNDKFFTVFSLNDFEPKKIKKSEIEELFGVKII